MRDQLMDSLETLADTQESSRQKAKQLEEVLLEMAFWFRAIEVKTVVEKISPPGTHEAIVKAYRATIE